MPKKINVKFFIGEELEHSVVVLREEDCITLYAEWERYAEVEAGSFTLTTTRGEPLRPDLPVGDLAPPRKENLKVVVRTGQEMDVRRPDDVTQRQEGSEAPMRCMDKEIVVCFRYLPDNSVEIEKMSEDTPMDQVRALWSEKTGLDVSDLHFMVGKRPLPKEGALKDMLPEPDAFNLAITIDSTFEVTLTLSGVPSSSWIEKVSPMATAADLIEKARLRFNVEEERQAKLRSADADIANGTKIRDLDLSQELEVDFMMTIKSAILRPAEYHPAIWVYNEKLKKKELLLEDGLPPAFPKDEGENNVVTTQTFMSSPAWILMSEERPFEEQRFLSSDLLRTAGAETKIGALLSEEEIKDGQTTFINELSINITLKRRWKLQAVEMCLWPTDQLNRLRKGNNDKTLYINGEKVKNLNKSFFETGYVHGSTAVLAEIMRLNVRDTTGQVHSIKVDKDMPFDDFLLLMKQIDSEDYLVTIDDTTILHSLKTLRQLGIKANSNVDLHFQERSVILEHGYEAFSTAICTSSNFDVLLQKASVALGIDLPRDTKFACRCGRLIEDKDDRRGIPKACCSYSGQQLVLRVHDFVDQKIETSDNFSQVSCRIPVRLLCEASKIFHDIIWWSRAQTKHHRMLTEESVLRTILSFFEAKDVKICRSGKILFTVEIAKERDMTLFLAPETKLMDVVEMIKRKTKKRVDNLSSRRLKIWLKPHDRESATLAEAPIRSGQLIMAHPYFRPDGATQTDTRRGAAVFQILSAVLAPQQLRLSVRNPHEEHEAVTVTAGSAGEALVRALPLQKVPLTGAAVFVSFERLYEADGTKRRAVECFDPAGGSYRFIDCEDGRQMEGREVALIMRFLPPSSLPTSPRLIPAITTYTDVLWLQIREDRRTEPAEDEAVRNPACVVMLRGYRCGKKREDIWVCADRRFVSAVTGKDLEFRDLPAGPRERFFCLLKDKDVIPRVPVPKDRFLWVLCRPGVSVRVEAGRLRAEAPAVLPDLERWERPSDITQLDRDITEAARK